ncbi:MAG TPA: hypothetical protein VEF76_11505 [Patescibacteria group bacterium]|nr:hypothetical protein [Patescibacteria group bacterium]
MQMKFVDGLVEQLKGQDPLPEMDGNPIYTLMQEKSLSGYKLAGIVRDLHEHRPVTQDRYGEDVQAPEKNIRIMTDATPDRATFAIVSRKPDADGTFGMLARISIERDEKGKWGIDTFHTALDPTGIEDNAHRYVDLRNGIMKEYKSAPDQFVANFLQGIAKGEDVWGALSNADYQGRIDEIFTAARKEEQKNIDDGGKPTSLRKIVESDYMPGQFKGYSGPEDKKVETRSAYAPTLRNGK